MNKVSEYYKNKDYAKIVNLFTMRALEDYDYKYLIYAMFETGNFETFIKLLKNPHINDILNNTVDVSRVQGYKGLYYYCRGNYIAADSCLKAAINSKGEYSRKAEEWLTLLKPNSPSILIENKLNFWFSPDLNIEERKSFVEKYKAAYDRIINIFPVELEKNIDVYVFAGWKDDLGNHLSYANEKMLTIHVNKDDDAGHELAHIICKKIIKIGSRFIDEGLAEYMDDLVRGYRITINGIKPDMATLYSSFASIDQEYAYFFSRIFVSSVFECFEGDLMKICPVLEISDFNELNNKMPQETEAIMKIFDKNVNRLLSNNRFGELVYVGRADCYKKM